MIKTWNYDGIASVTIVEMANERIKRSIARIQAGIVMISTVKGIIAILVIEDSLWARIKRIIRITWIASVTTAVIVKPRRTASIAKKLVEFSENFMDNNIVYLLLIILIIWW